jgi:SET and MYND domain-containing protein
MLEIRHVPHGGRSYFASQALEEGDTVLIEEPSLIVSAIYKVFRQECCIWCFHYDLGKNMKIVLDSQKSGASIGRCCSEECETLSMTRSAVHMQMLGKLDSSIAEEDMLRFCCSALALHKSDQSSYAEMLELQDGSNLFDSEDLRAIKNITDALVTAFPDWKADRSIAQIVHDAMSRSRVNCFGIWEQHNGRSFPESEQLGWALYPRSSFFNHACTPNIAKLRIGRLMCFSAMRAIKAGEELTISYLGDREFDSSADRRDAIREWGFDCNCAQCQRELTETT